MKLPFDIIPIINEYSIELSGGECVLLKLTPPSFSRRSFRLRYITNVEEFERSYIVPNTLENILTCLKEREPDNYSRITIRDNRTHQVYSLSKFLELHSDT